VFTKRCWRKNRPQFNLTVCGICDVKFNHIEVMKMRLHKFMNYHKITITEEDIDNFRCLPPSANWIPDAKEQALFASVLLDYQFHYENHASTCFKVTSRTPSGTVCRFLFPKLLITLKSFVDEHGQFHFLQLFGLEYYNMCNILLSRLLHTNSDMQVLFNAEGRHRTAYVTKYSFKPQKRESSFVMKFGLILKTAESVVNREDNNDISVETRGRRLINGSLFKITKPFEVPATLAAFSIINKGSLHFFSHEASKLRLDSICASYVEAPWYDPFDQNHPNNYIEQEESHLVNITLSANSLFTSTNDDDGVSNPLDNEIARTISIGPMIDYQKRPLSLENFNFIELREQYHIVTGKPKPNQQMLLGHHYIATKYWNINPYGRRACAVMYGRKLPNILKNSLSQIDKEFYYKSLLVLFKPHRHGEELLGAGELFLIR